MAHEDLVSFFSLSPFWCVPALLSSFSFLSPAQLSHSHTLLFLLLLAFLKPASPTMSAVPVYRTGCIAPTLSGSGVWLVGIPSTYDGRIEAYTVGLDNLDSPVAQFRAGQNDVFWKGESRRACFNYPGAGSISNGPILMQQFGSESSYFTNLYPNGTIDLATNFNTVGFVSDKLFSLIGAVGGLNWFTAVSNVTWTSTNSRWTGVRLNATDALYSYRE